MSGKMNQKRSETLIKKVNNNTESLIQRLTNMVALSASTSTQEVQASEMLQIEYSSSMIVRLVEELLSVSRTLKENWILGQLPKPNDEDEKDVTVGSEDKMNEVLRRILRTKQFDEEGGDDTSEDEAEDEEEDEDEEMPQVNPEEITALDTLVSDIIVAAPTTAVESEPVPIKVEPSTSAPVQIEPQQQQQQQKQPAAETTQPSQSNQVKTEPGPNPSAAPVYPPVAMPDTIDITDTADMLGDYDFDNFGTMDDQENDIIMID